MKIYAMKTLPLLSKLRLQLNLFAALTWMILLFTTQPAAAQVAVNTTGAAASSSAMLDVSSTNKGILFPRMTETQRDAISSPETGLLVFVTSDSSFYFYDGTQWTLLKTGNTDWTIDGTSLYPDSLVNVGVGTSTPSGKFEVATPLHTGTYGSDICSGGNATAYEYYGPGYEADKAFDDNTSSYWSNNGNFPVWIRYNLGAGNSKRAGKYRIYYENASSDYSHSPAIWQFQASQNGTSWTNLDSQSSQLWTTDGWKEYSISNETSYQYYRIVIVDNQTTTDNYVSLFEVEILEEEISNQATLFVDDNQVGIGTSSPAASLDIDGTLRLTDGNESTGKVLVSDASGNASWTDGATVNGGGWTLNGDTIYNTGKMVGIGTDSPEATLDVDGPVKVGDNSASDSPQAGMVRWNSTTEDFEGFNGSDWVSLTKSNGGWGGNYASETSQAIASDGSSSDYFGYSVSIDGDYAIVGAYNKTVGSNSHQGQAYIYYFDGSTWGEQDILTASDGTSDDYFGISVSISGDYAIVGAQGKDVGSNSYQGQVYIFYRSGTSWTEQDIITASDGAAYDLFGCDVAISGNYAIVGAMSKDVGPHNSQGGAYIYHRVSTSWIEQQILTSSDGTAGDEFGCSVALSEDYAVVGAYYKQISSVNPGEAYIYHRNGTTWTEQATLIASDAEDKEHFGRDVSISGDYVAIGAPYKEVNSNTLQGEVYIFSRDGTTWSEQDIISASDGAETDHFGKRLSLSGSSLIVGAYGKTVAANTSQGRAYIYHRTGSSWSEQAKLTSSDGSESDLFGWDVSISSDYAIVGANYKDVDGNSNQGKIYWFEHQ